MTLYVHTSQPFDSIMTFNVILEDTRQQPVFITVEDCKDIDDLISHVHAEFTGHTIEQITPVS